MPTPSWDNLEDFLDPDDFAVVATITPKAGLARRVNGLYDDDYLSADTGEYTADSGTPRLTCKLVDVVGVKRGDAVFVPGEGHFSVLSDPHQDGTGTAVLKLARNAGP